MTILGRRFATVLIGSIVGLLLCVPVALAADPGSTGHTTVRNVKPLVAADGQITGKVTAAATTAAIDGIEVCAYPSFEEFDEFLGACATTNSSGQYTLTGLTTGEYIVEFFPPNDSSLNYQTQYYSGKSSYLEATTVPVTDGSTTSGIDAAMSGGGQIAGKVTAAATKAALGGIEVCADPAIEGPGRCAITNASGEYTVAGLATGEYDVEFFVPYESSLNYLTQYYNDKSALSEASRVPVTVGNTATGIDAAMLSGGQITGTVTAAATKAAIGGVEACVYQVFEEDGGESYDTVRCATTNASGEYTVSALSTGEYTVGFTVPGESGLNYVTQYYDGKSTLLEGSKFAVTAGSTTTGIGAALLAGGEITGKVSAAATTAELQGVEVCAAETSAEYINECARTNASGEYTITGLATGEYTVDFDSGGESNYLIQYYSGKALASEASKVSVTAGSTTPGIDAALLAGGEITGKVTAAATKAAIQDIEVCATASGVADDSECASTNSSGEYTISGLATAEYAVEFSSYDYNLNYLTQYYNGKALTSEASKVSVTAGGTTPGVDAALLAGGQITGKVTSAVTKAAIDDIEVCATASSVEYEGQMCTDTNAGGEYTLLRLTTAEYKVDFYSDSAESNYLYQYYNGKATFSEATKVPVTAGSTTTGINAALLAGGEITGKVTAAATKAAIDDIEVCASSSSAERCATTNASGEYTVSSLPTGEYTVEFTGYYESLNYFTQYYNGKSSSSEASKVSVTAGSTTPGINAALQAGGEITGKVTAAATGEAISSIEVCATASSVEYEEQTCTTTNAGGEYIIPRLTTDEYKVWFDAELGEDNYLTQYYSGQPSFSDANKVAVTAGSTTAGINAAMVAGGEIAGKVTATTTKAAIEGIEVCASSNSGDRCATTNANGEYIVTALTTGEYTVEFSGHDDDLNYLTQYYSGKSSFSEASKVSVTTGSTTPGIDAALQAGGQITGKVTSATTQAAIGDIEVCASSSSNEYEDQTCTSTNSSGEYAVSGLATGEYKVKFYSFNAESGYQTQYYNGKSSFSEANTLSVTAGSAIPEIDAAMLTDGEITGKVTAATTKAAIGGIEVCASSSGGGFIERCATTNAGGEYTVSGLTTGEYTVEFSVPYESSLNYLTQYYNDKALLSEADKVSVTAGSTTPGIDAALQAGGEITGNVTAAVAKTAIGGIQVCATSSGGEFVEQCATTDSSGEYTVAGLTTGEYTVRFYDPSDGYLIQYYEDKSSFSEANKVSVTEGSTSPGINAAMQANETATKPVNSEAPQVSGTPAVGQTLLCSAGSWSGTPTPTFTYQWLREGAAITGATSESYTVQTSDQGHGLVCEVTASNSAGKTAAQSTPVSIPAEAKPVNTGAPQVAGTPAVGSILSCSAGSWSGTPAPTFAYQWLREGAAITGATSSSYTVQSADQGHGLVCEVTASNSAGKTSADSTAVQIPAPAPAKPVNTEAPQVSGTPAIGQTLSCSTGSWSGTPAPTFAYRWLREGSAIAGEASSTYVVQAVDEGHTLTCEVTAKNSVGEKSATSTGVAIPASSSGGTQPGGSTGGGSTGGGGSTTPATTPATPEGSGGVLAAKAISGNVSLAGFTITVQSSGKAAVKLGCASTTTCAGQLTLTAKTKGNGKKKAKTETIGTASFSIPAGETVTVKLALTGAGKALLSAAHGHLSATLTILKSSPAPAATQTDGVHLVLQKAVKAKKSKV